MLELTDRYYNISVKCILKKIEEKLNKMDKNWRTLKGIQNLMKIIKCILKIKRHFVKLRINWMSLKAD